MTDKKVNVNFSWMPFWIAGWLFTAGAGGFSSIPIPITFLDKVNVLLVMYFGWPFFLGGLIFK